MASTQPDSLPSPRECSGCGQSEGESHLKTCAKCSAALYCSRECQTAHWKVHKKECRNPNSNATQQISEAPLLGLWNEKLYKRTTPSSFLRQDPTPKEIKAMSGELPEITRSIYSNPKNPTYLMHRAMNLSKLELADLAAGDAYKAIQLLDAILRWFLGDSKSNYEDLSGTLRDATAKATDLQKSSYLWFGSILKDTFDMKTAQKIIQAARIRLEEQEMVHQMQKATINSNFWSLDSTFGHVYHIAYPFIPKVFLGRNEELIQKTKKEIETEAKALFSSCTLGSSTVQDPMDSKRSGAPTALGIFATRDIAEGQPFLIDTTVLAATEKHDPTGNAVEICDNCCGIIPTNSTQKRSARCCTVLYCSQKCRNLAWNNYHQVLCKQDFSWVWEDSKTGTSKYDLDGPM